MNPCDKLKIIVFHHYRKFDSGEQAASIKNIYSLEEGVVVIDHDSILAFMRAGGSSKLDSTHSSLGQTRTSCLSQDFFPC